MLLSLWHGLRKGWIFLMKITGPVNLWKREFYGSAGSFSGHSPLQTYLHSNADKKYNEKANACSLQWQYKPCLELPRIQCQDYTKHNTETNNMSARGCKTYSCHQNPRADLILTWKTNELQNMTRNINDF